jgi:ammonium transporter Rh
MAVLGFGFLMTFLRKYQYSAIGFTLLTVAFTFQWGLIITQFFEMAYLEDYKTAVLTQQALIGALYATVTVLISFGSVLGVVSAFQLLLIAMYETVLYGINQLIVRELKIYSDDHGWSPFGFGGDATTVHVFGAFFGIALAIPLGLRVKRKGKGHDDEAASYGSDMFAMIGTIFLFVLWPSFNAALAPPSTQHRVVVNTVLALCASVVFAFLGSRVFRGGKFDMKDVQNATLAGGVGIGNVAAIVTGPGSAVIIGAVCAVVATLGYAYVSPRLAKYGVVDTRGVLDAHGFPGIIGALSAIISLAIAYNNNDDGFVYGQSLDSFFARGQPTAVWLLLSLIITIVLALAGGLLAGFAMYFLTKPNKRLYSDDKHFRVPSDFDLPVDDED